jgi:hypothetical protein
LNTSLLLVVVLGVLAALALTAAGVALAGFLLQPALQLVLEHLSPSRLAQGERRFHRLMPRVMTDQTARSRLLPLQAVVVVVLALP